jgi:hypothetical protein
MVAAHVLVRDARKAHAPPATLGQARVILWRWRAIRASLDAALADKIRERERLTAELGPRRPHVAN